ncbi:hypothetical protein WJX73_002049 [Symbiochloris irregularis]|uniref:NADP-dependent oxidoreductase domain-containing protein n=1 Tax=Symbiochloris irregularis TaxID=706552 RepID=A0AAW1P261_9CHLO
MSTLTEEVPAVVAGPQLPGEVGAVKDGKSHKSKRGPRPEKTERYKSFELALERGSSQELLQTQPEGTKEAKGDFQVVSQPYATLNNGVKIPLIGLGTFKSEDTGMDEVVHAALRAGFRHIDAAQHYLNEPAIGVALEKAFQAQVCAREEVFITSKLWNTDHGREDVRPALLQTLKDLRLKYLDNYLIHWPVVEPQQAGELSPSIQETWQALEECVDEGLVRCIGVSNFSVKQLERVLSYARIRPAINQVEVHPFWRNDALISFCKKEGVHVSAYCPMGTPWTSAKAVIRRAPSCSSHPVVQEIARKYNKHALLVLIRWGIQHGTSVLAKSSNPHHIRQNLEGTLGWHLAPQDFDAISNIDFQLRLVDGIRFLRPEGPYRNMDEMWDETETEECRQKFIRSVYKFPKMPSVKLATGQRMPMLGMGSWRAGNAQDTVERALRSGVRHIDCSSQYGSEKIIGAAMEEVFSDWLVDRPEVFLTSRVWMGEEGMDMTMAEEIRHSCKQTLSGLKTSYLDLYLLPADSHRKMLKEAWRGMEALVKEGLVRSIGLYGGGLEALQSVTAICKIAPAVIATELHPHCCNLELLDFCKSKGVQVVAAAWPAGFYKAHKEPHMLKEATVQDTAQGLGKTPAQVLIRWALQLGACVCPKAASHDHIKGILDVLKWELSPEQFEALCSVTQHSTIPLAERAFSTERAPSASYY